MKIHETHKYLAAKLMGGFFAVIVAPIFVGIGVNMIQKRIDRVDAASKTEEAATSSSNTAAKKPEPANTKAPEIAALQPPSKPAEGPSISLFNGKDLEGFHTFLGPDHPGGKPLGRDHDPAKVFAVTPEGWLRISGKVFGALETEEEYENYHLTVEYRWGEKRWPPREKLDRLSGVVVHCAAPGENPADKHVWRPGFRARIMDEQGAGDLALFPTGTTHLSLAMEADVHEIGAKHHGVRYDYVPGAPLTTITGHTLIHRRGASLTLPPEAEIAAAETPFDRNWHTLECLCPGDRLTILWDGKKVLEASKLSQSRGRIHFISEGATIFFRNITIRKYLDKP